MACLCVRFSMAFIRLVLYCTGNGAGEVGQSSSQCLSFPHGFTPSWHLVPIYIFNASVFGKKLHFFTQPLMLALFNYCCMQATVIRLVHLHTRIPDTHAAVPAL